MRLIAHSQIQQLSLDEDYESAQIETSNIQIGKLLRYKLKTTLPTEKMWLQELSSVRVNYGNSVRLVTEVKGGRMFFLFDPENSYGDLEGVRTLRHSCQDLSNCGG